MPKRNAEIQVSVPAGENNFSPENHTLVECQAALMALDSSFGMASLELGRVAIPARPTAHREPMAPSYFVLVQRFFRTNDAALPALHLSRYI
jgi:hypothetical protein